MRRAAGITAALAALAVATLGVAAPAAAGGVPYSDPAQVGTIGFCDAQGHPIDSGSLDAVPFAAKAIGSAAAAPPYDQGEKVAYLEAYQPREGLTPLEWSGEQLISPSVYADAAHPTVIGTAGEISLRQFVEDYPPQWDGLVQLRLYLKTDEMQTDVLHYAATDLRIDGATWQVVNGGAVSCSQGRARSVAAILAPSAAGGALNSGDNPAPTDGGSPASPRTGDPSDPTGGAAPSNLPSGPAATDGAHAAASAAPASDDGSFPTGYVVLGGLAALLALALALSNRDRLRGVLTRRAERDG